MKMIYAFVQFS